MTARVRTRHKPPARQPARQPAHQDAPRLAAARVHLAQPAPTLAAERTAPMAPGENTLSQQPIQLNVRTAGSQVGRVISEPGGQTKTAAAEPRGPHSEGASERSGERTQMLLEAALLSPQEGLPQRAVLERAFGSPLSGVCVHRGPAAQAALAALGAPAATYQGRILLAEPAPSVHLLAHEVVHVLQSRRALTAPHPAVEGEAQRLASRADRRAGLPTALGVLAPLQPSVGLAPQSVSLFSSAPVEAPPETQSATQAAAPVAAPAAAAPAQQPLAAAEAGRGASGASAAPAGVGLLEAPNPPPPGVEADAAASAEAAQQARAALESADSAAGVMQAFADAPPSLKAQLAGEVGSRINGVLADETQTLQEATPPVEAHLAQADAAPAPAALQVTAPAAPPVNVEPQPPAPAPTVDLPPTPAPGSFQANNGVVAAVTQAQPAAGDRARQLDGALDSVQTRDPGIPTRPSEPPRVPLEGQTDPARLQSQVEEGRTQARDNLAAAQANVLSGPGPESVQPVAVDESHPIENLVAPAVAETPAPAEAGAYLAMNLPPEVQASFDQQNGGAMQASVAGAQTQIAGAAEQRDQQHQTEVQTAQQQNETLLREADQTQRQQVGAARTQIQGERQRTLDEQAAAVHNVETEADARRTQDRTAIDSRVQQDEAAVQGRYDQTERDAQAEIQGGEQRAEERRRQSEREAEDQSWWERAVNFVRDAFNALVSVIGSIFDAVRRAVNVLLDAARDFAIGLINAVSSFVQAAIAAFGAFLTTLVQGLLGDLFPGLAARLTQAINAVVTAAQQAVAAVAEGLRRGVNALTETLRAGINAVINAYQNAVNTALAVLQAVVTGDWSALARRVLEAVLSLLGIDPQAFYAFIGQVQDTFQLIVDNPGGFLRNILGAVVGGVQNFANNFLQHLQAGIISWLTGALGGAGITLPEHFNLMGVLSLVQQILGLTWANIRQRAVRLVGERAVQALEFVASYIETLITGGWAALWERIQSDLATLRDMVFEQIRTFLIERVVLAAIQWLASFNPIGGIVRILMTAYNFFMFLRDQLQRIFAVAQTVVGALNDIARGNLAPAMQAVEGVLARLLPIVIDLLARILGLGNVGGSVREIIQNIQNTLWGAIDRLLDRVLASFRGGGAAAGAQGAAAGAAAGQNEDEPINFAGHQYIFRVHVEGNQATVLAASSPFNELETKVREIRDVALVNLRRSRSSEDRTLAQDLERRLDQVVARSATISQQIESAPPSRQAGIARNGLTTLRELMNAINTDFRLNAPDLVFESPTHQFEHDSLDTWGRATRAKGNPISRASRNHGSRASANPPGKFILNGIAAYESGHLVAKSLGGPGNLIGNLAPVSSDTNRSAEGFPTVEGIRRAIYKEHTDKPYIVEYTVACRYRPDGVASLDTELVRDFGAAQDGAAYRLFRMAGAAVTNDEVVNALHRSTAATANIEQLALRVRKRWAYYFLPYEFQVDMQVRQQPQDERLREQISAPRPILNHQGVSLR